LTKSETLARIPTLEPDRLRGGVIYFDGQFDDARLAVNLAQSIVDAGGTPVNYTRVVGLTYSGKMIDGVQLEDAIDGSQRRVRARVVINATGIFTDSLLRMDQKTAAPLITHSQGVHLVLEKRFLKGRTAIMVPQTEDGRVLFAVPWHDRVLVGTTDTPVEGPSLEPRPLEKEIDFILKHAAQYMVEDPTRQDILCMFAGLRPLVGAGGGKQTSALSRDHHLEISRSGLVTITGGKWTTYRKMAEDTVDQASLIAGLPESECRTRKLRIHGWLKNMDPQDPLAAYGSDAVYLRNLIDADPEMGEKLHPKLPYLKAEVVWAVRSEMALTLDDVLARRTRSLILDTSASMAVASDTAQLMAAELGKVARWQREQVAAYTRMAQGYLPN
jgi:glycerol-3-phosphate dehydrogenase